MTGSKVLADTGPIVALLDRGDGLHFTAHQQAQKLTSPLFTSWPVITEACWLLRGNKKATEKLMTAQLAGWLTILHIDGGEMVRVGEIMKRYHNLKLQLADASLLFLAKRDSIPKIFTFDRKDFSILIANSKPKLELLP